MKVYIVTREDYMSDRVIVACFRVKKQAKIYATSQWKKLPRSARDMGLAGYSILEEELR